MERVNPTPVAVFFDWDGTLVDTLPFLLTAHNHVRAMLGLAAWSVEEFKSYIRYSSRELYPTIYGARSDEALGILRKFMEANHLKHLKVLPDAKDLLEVLAAAGIPAGIISNKRHETLLREVAHLGWEHLTRISIGAGFARKDKPEADPLLAGLNHCGVKPAMDVWYVGDSETDLRTARAAGCSAVLVRHNHDNGHLVEAFDPEYVFDDCIALKTALFGRESRRKIP